MNQIYQEHKQEIDKHFEFEFDLTILEVFNIFSKYIDQAELHHFLDFNLATILKQVFVGNVDEISAAMILSGRLECIKKPPKVELEVVNCEGL